MRGWGWVENPRMGPSIGSLKAKWSKRRNGSNGLARLGPKERRSSTPAPSITYCGSRICLTLRGGVAIILSPNSKKDNFGQYYIKGKNQIRHLVVQSRSKPPNFNPFLIILRI